MIFLKQALVQTAYEGAKVAVKRHATNADVADAMQAVLNGRTLENTTITIRPRDVSQVDRGEFISITISAPSDTNSVFPFGPFQGQRIEATAEMVKE